MIKKLFEQYYRSIKKSDLHFSPNLSSWTLLHFYFPYILMRLRALLFLFKAGYLGSNVKIKFGSNLELAPNFKVGDGVQICCLSENKNKIGKSFSIGRLGKIRSSSSPTTIGSGFIIGDYVGMGDFCYLGCFGGVTIDDHTIIGERLLVHSDAHDFSDLEVPVRQLPTVGRPVYIGKRCWIGSDVIILGGVTIEDDCVVGAGSVVTKSFKKGSVIAGNPARILKSRVDKIHTDHLSDKFVN